MRAFDAHVHSAVSPDSEMPALAAIEGLARQGLGCIFTEHADLHPNPDGENFIADLDVYPEKYLLYKSDTVGLGLEIGLTPQRVADNKALALNPALDYIIGSIHWTDGWDLAFAPEFFAQLGEEAYRRHLLYARDMVEQNDFFHVLGHIDYISRYSPLPEKNVLYENYVDEYDQLLRALIQRDKLLELNTARLGDESACRNLYKIFSRYRALGGKQVTLGSDAHDTARLGYRFDAALRIIAEIGLTEARFI